MEQRNLIIAMVLMAVIWVSYFSFFAPQTPPPPPEQIPAEQTQQQTADGAAPAPGATATIQPATMDRTMALAQSPRVRIDSPRISGSIALKGGPIVRTGEDMMSRTRTMPVATAVDVPPLLGPTAVTRCSR